MELDLPSLLERLGEPGTLAAVAPFWETSLATLPTGELPFLQRQAIEASATFCGLDEQVTARAWEVARRIGADPRLKALAWHGERRLTAYFEDGEFRGWPSLQPAMGEDRGVFYLLLGLAMIPRIRRLHEQLGFPESVTRDTCQVVASISQNFLRFEGGVGLPRRQLHWTRHHVAGRLVRIGRLEWMKKPFRGQVHVYRHRQTGQVVALAEGGQVMTAQGLAHFEGDPLPDDAWTTRFRLTASAVTGHPVSPQGVVLRREVELPLSAWTHRLSRGMPTLELHIPAGGGMTLPCIHESMRETARFFDRHVPDWPYAAFGCISWILNTQLQEILPADANMVQFQKQLYLFPVATPPTSGFFFLFGQDQIDLDHAPQHTSLQRRVVSFLRQGHRWRGGAMFYLPEDLDQFGQEPYQRNWSLDALPSLEG